MRWKWQDPTSCLQQRLVVPATGKELTVARARSTFGKLQRDQAKKDRAKAKMDDRLSRKEDKVTAAEERATTPSGEEVDQTKLLEQFEIRQEELRAKLVV